MRGLPLALSLAHCLLMPSVSHAAERGADRRAAGERYQLRIESDGWGGASVADLGAVYRSACNEIAVHLEAAGLSEVEAMRIRHDPSGPIVLFNRSLRGELVVLLNARGKYWSQHAYQMAHEFCHILCRFKNGDRANLWFEESLCEMASIYALRQMAITWRDDPPYPNWRDYSASLQSYADDLTGKYLLPGGVPFVRWFQAQRVNLQGEATQRELNGIVAVQLLPIFERDPRAWQTLRFLNVGRGKQHRCFECYLEDWRANTPAQLKPLVDEISRPFQIRLDRPSR